MKINVHVIQKNRVCIALLQLVLLLFTIVHVSEGQTGTNPIYKDAFTADPSPLLYNGVMYVYVGHDEAYNGEATRMTEWLCYSTTDMKNWTNHGAVMKPTDFKWASRDAWAAQVVERGGKFYLFVTVTASGQYSGRCIGVGVSDKPTGPFVDAIGAPLVHDRTTPSANAWDDIDPTVLLDDDGSAYLFWGNPNCYFVKLKPSLIAMDGAIKNITPTNYHEGPWIHKRRGMYYLTYAAFVPPNGNEQLCYATATNINGPWTYRGVLTGPSKNSYTIHPGIAEYKGQSYLFYQNVTLTLNGQAGNNSRRSVAADYLCYNADGTMKYVTQTTAGLTAPLLCPTKAPYGGVAWPIPGRIEAENYDFGGELSGFHEIKGDGNLGGSAYRGGDEVDVETTMDSEGKYNIAYVQSGEWLEYTTNVSATGKYDISLRVATSITGKSIHIEVDGQNVTGAISVPNTTGFQVWQTAVIKNINLTAGKRLVRIVFDGDNINLNYVKFDKSILTSIEDQNEMADGMKVSSNPFSGEGFVIQASGEFEYSIYSLSGKLLEQGLGNNRQLAGIELPTGMYLLSVKSEQATFTRKMIRQ